jgi:hypothetical protein
MENGGDDDLVQRATAYATQAHERIDQRRKYSNQPYADHLKAVVDILSTVTLDPVIHAAAWLHDVVEDTPATIEEIEHQFGKQVAQLVNQLTDISQLSEGNRARRKEIDRAHLALASPQAKTIKLADLLDNCNDICRSDPRFGKVFIKEAVSLLKVLTEGDPVLLQRATRVIESWQNQFDKKSPGNPAGDERHAGPHQRLILSHILGRFFARDLSRDLPPSFTYQASQIVTGDASLVDVIGVLTRHQRCIVSSESNENGSLPTIDRIALNCQQIERKDFSSPIARMWLFGIITAIELDMKMHILEIVPEALWASALTPARYERARLLMEERERRQQSCSLLECLQLGDFLAIMLKTTKVMSGAGFKSKNAAKRVFGDLEMLRNYLAHSQPIGDESWLSIARLADHVHSCNQQLKIDEN